MFDPIDLAAAIKKLRGGRTQKEVANAGGIDETAWSLYESGGRRPTARSVSKIAQGLGCTVDRLEEEVWAARKRRRAEEQAALPAAATPAADSRSPIRLRLREHLAGIARHVEEIFLLTQDPGAEPDPTPRNGTKS
jgi:transcriptional regulator with XRE-family HTH domain